MHSISAQGNINTYNFAPNKRHWNPAPTLPYQPFFTI